MNNDTRAHALGLVEAFIGRPFVLVTVDVEGDELVLDVAARGFASREEVSAILSVASDAGEPESTP